MSENSSVIGMILGSSLISAIVSITYNQYLVPRKDVLQREINFINTLNVVTKDQTDRDENGRLVFISRVLVPMYSKDEKFAPIVLSLLEIPERNSSLDEERSREAALTSNSSLVTTSEVAQALEKRGAIPEKYTTNSIRDTFFSGYRRQFSDELVRLIDGGKTELVEHLINAIIENDVRREYRVNLYIAFTLARVSKWSATSDLFERFKNLKETDNYKDATFENHVDTALKRYQKS